MPLEWPGLLLSLIAAGAVLFLPGLAALDHHQRRRLDSFETAAEAAALSIGLTALAGLAAFLGGVTIRLPLLLALYGLCVPIALIRFIRARPAHLRWYSLLAGALLLSGLLALRFVQAKDLALPPWVDSLHHTLLVQKILAAGGLPETLQPELDAPLFYHFAYHLLAAAQAALSGLPAHQAVLFSGQVLNGLTALAVYRLGMALWRERRVAVLAALLAVVGFHLPAYYLTWGRFTLLAGLVVLPVALARLIKLTDDDEPRPVTQAAGLALLTAGTILSHYLTGGMLALFALIFIPAKWLSDLRRGTPPRWLPAALGGLAGGALLAAPWLARAWQLGSRLAALQFPTAESANPAALQSTLALLGPLRSHLLFALAGGGLILALIRPGLRIVAVWAGMLALLALPGSPRLDPFRPDQVAITLYLPASLLAAGALTAGGDALGRLTRPRIGTAALLLAVLGLTAWGTASTWRIVNPNTVLASSADLRALEWARAHTPADSLFFINTTLWQTGSYRGVDGGYWLPVIAGRRTILPPAMYGWGSSESIRRVNQAVSRASQVSECNADFDALQAELGFTHIYIKEGVGQLQPAGLIDCPGLQLIYERDGVAIYALSP